MRSRLCFFAIWLCVYSAMGQEALTNDAIIKMIKGGLSDAVIVQMIQSQPGNYVVTPDSMMSLKQSGLSDQVMAAMASKNNGTSRLASEQAVVDESIKYDDLDYGVYRKVKNNWVALTSERVDWKTGAVLKAIATDGIVKGDVNGHLKGGESPTRVNSPLEFLIRTAENIDPNDYQLVHLHAKSNQREFRTMTGGVFHASGGSSRDGIQFDAKKIAKHTYLVTLTQNATAGEYAFLAPCLANSTTSGSTGKAFTFHFVE